MNTDYTQRCTRCSQGQLFRPARVTWTFRTKALSSLCAFSIMHKTLIDRKLTFWWLRRLRNGKVVINLAFKWKSAQKRRNIKWLLTRTTTRKTFAHFSSCTHTFHICTRYTCRIEVEGACNAAYEQRMRTSDQGKILRKRTAAKMERSARKRATNLKSDGRQNEIGDSRQVGPKWKNHFASASNEAHWLFVHLYT